MNNKLKNTLEKLMLALFVGLAFFTPIIFTSSTAEFYEFPKMFFVYITGTTLVAVFLVYKVIFGGKSRLPSWPVLGYFGAILISTVFTSHAYTSLWGYYSRFNGGLVSYLVFFGIYLVALNFLGGKEGGARGKFLSAVSLSLFPISLYGIFQISQQARIFSTFGQPNWLASYIVFVLPLVLWQAATEQVDLKRFFWIAVLIFGFINLWFTSSLSGVAGLVTAFLYLAITYRKKVLNKWVLVGVVAFFILGALNFNFIKNRVFDALVFSTDPKSYKVSDPGLIRAGLWQGSLKMSVSSPKNFFLGTGPETFPYEYPSFRPDLLNYSSEWDFILNKPHNYYLEILVESGIAALAFYAIIMFKALVGKKEGVEKFLSAGLVGFFATNFFGWPTVYTSLLFWVWLAIIFRNNSS